MKKILPLFLMLAALATASGQSASGEGGGGGGGCAGPGAVRKSSMMGTMQQQSAGGAPGTIMCPEGTAPMNGQCVANAKRGGAY
jgi:hypothetical protein